MAVFGAPLAHEDDPERAIRAAFALREWAACEKELELRIGVNTGEALVRLEARPEAGEGIAAGDVVNTAARLQAAAPVGGILVGAATYRATEQVIDYRETEPVVAKGKAQPVDAWEALEARSRFGVDVEQAPRSALVGRERELRLLQRRSKRACEEQEPQLVTLVGVPGIGKSRIVYELFRTFDASPRFVTWRQGRCLPYGEGVSFWALAEMVKAQAGILESESDETVRQSSPRRSQGSCLKPIRAGSSAGSGRSSALPEMRRATVHAKTASRPGDDFSKASPSRGPRCSCSRTSLGRRRPARLPRRVARVDDRRALARGLHGSTGAALEARRLGRRQDECPHVVAAAALDGGDGAARARAARASGAAGRAPARPDRARGRQPALRGGVRTDGRRTRRRRVRRPGDGPGDHRRPTRCSCARAQATPPARGRRRQGVLGRRRRCPRWKLSSGGRGGATGASAT